MSTGLTLMGGCGDGGLRFSDYDAGASAELADDSGARDDALGACCDDTSCQTTTQLDCEQSGGTYGGDGSECQQGAGEERSVSSSVSVAIPDGGGAGNPVTQTIIATESFTIADLQVTLDVTHTWTGDLTIRLDHGGRTMRLVDRSLSPGVEFGCDKDNFVGLVLDQQGAGGNIEDACADNLTSPPSYVPVDNLDTFVGLDFAGEWKITVYDNEPDDFGTLDGWTVTARSASASTCPDCLDGDSDGVSTCDGDCDDGNSNVAPGAPELCDGVDNDCDGLVDAADDDALGLYTFYADGDGDGYGDAGSPVEACAQPSGAVTDATDCDDASAAVHPGAAEVCDGVDNDCDGLADGADSDATGLTAYYPDGDGDGYGSAGGRGEVTVDFPAEASDADEYDYYYGTPYMAVMGDSYTAYRSADPLTSVDELRLDFRVDQSYLYCNAYLLFYFDEQYLGYAYLNWAYWYTDVKATVPVTPSTAAEHALRVELYNTVATSYCWYSYVELDTDRGSLTLRGEQEASPILACEAPQGYGEGDDDCDDRDAAVNPGAAEVCNGRDDDCDGGADEGAGATYYMDQDGDGFGVAGSTAVSCHGAPLGYANIAGDCDDLDADVSPDAQEICNDLDDDCDGYIDGDDDSVEADLSYADEDGDGYGAPGTGVATCTPGAGTVSNGDDCDDADAAVSPEAQEVCNGLDDDCDGLIDDDDPDVEGQVEHEVDGGGPDRSITTTTPAAPGPNDVYRLKYGYPYFGKAGDYYRATRDTGDLEGVDEISVDLHLDTAYLYCYAYLLVYMDDDYLGYLTVQPFTYDQHIRASMPLRGVDGGPHTYELELYNTIYNSYCWNSWFRFKGDSKLTLTGPTGGTTLSCEEPGDDN